MGVVSKIIDRVARRNPIEYARKLGVKVGNECRFTGNPGWGSEPWLIQIGNHVLLSSDIKFMSCEGRFLFLTDKQVYSSEPGESQNSGKTRGLPMEQLSDNDCIKR